MARYDITNGPSNKRLIRHFGSDEFPRVPGIEFTIQLKLDLDDRFTGARPGHTTIRPEILMLKRKSAGLDYPSDGVHYQFEADISDHQRFKNVRGFYDTRERRGWIEGIG